MVSTPTVYSRDNPAPLTVRAEARTMFTELRVRETRESGRVKAAIVHPCTWVTEFTETWNEHWVKEGRPSPYEPFPRHEFFPPLFDIFLSERIVWIEKTRDVMVSWACVAYLTWKAMTVPHYGAVLQCQKDLKVIQLVNYAKCLYRRQPGWLQDAFPLSKPLHSQGDHDLTFAKGGYLLGVPGGANQVRQYHPAGYLNDESSFQPEAGECFDEVLSAVSDSIIFNSSAGPGWYADARRGIVRNEE